MAIGNAKSGIIWMFLGTGGQALVQLATLVVLARLLTPEDFGVVAAALVVVGFSAIFSQLGIGPAVVQRKDLQPEHVRVAVLASVVMGFVLAGVVYLAAPWIAAFFDIDNLTPVLRVMCLIFPVQGLGVVAESLMQRELHFRGLAALEFVSVFVGYVIVGIGMAWLGYGVWSLVGAHLTNFGLKTVFLLVVEPHAKRPLWDRRAFGDLMYFSGGFTLARISNYTAGQGDNLIVGRFLGAAALGVYGRAYQLMTAPAILFGQVLDRVLFPVMAKVQDQPAELAQAYRRGVAAIALLVLPMAAYLAIVAPEFIAVVLGSQWSHVVLPFQILAAGMLFRTSYKMSDSLARATGVVYRRAWRQFVYAILVLVGAWVGQFWGLAGVATGVASALAVNFLLMAHLSLDVAHMSWPQFAAAHGPGLATGLVTAAATAAAVFALREWRLSPVVVLACSALLLMPIAVLAWRLPAIFLGQDGRWFFSVVLDRKKTANAIDAQPPEVLVP